MNKSTTILILVLFVLMLAGGAFFFLKPTSRSNLYEQGTRTNPVTGLNEDSTAVDDESTSISGNLMELIKLGKNYSCEFDYTDDTGNSTKGMVYISDSGNKFRGEFEMTQGDGTVVTSNMLSDGEYNYMWSSELPQGFKFKITSEDDSLFGDYADEETSSTPSSFDADMNVDFDCDAWRVDNSMFEVPSNIEFMDTSSYMNSGSEETSAPYVQDACSACNQVPAGDSREQCLQAFGC